MAVIPTSKGNRVTWTASGENTAVSPIPTQSSGAGLPGFFSDDFFDNPDKYNDPDSVAFKQYLNSIGYDWKSDSAQVNGIWVKGRDIMEAARGQYLSQNPSAMPAADIPIESATATPAPTQMPTTTASVPWFNDSGAGSGASSPQKPITSSGGASASAPASASAAPQSESGSSGQYPWYVERSVSGTYFDGEKVVPIYGKNVAVMSDGTKYDADYAAKHADELLAKHYGVEQTNDIETVKKTYKSYYKLLDDLYGDSKSEEEKNLAALKMAGLDPDTLFGSGGGGRGGTGISPLAAWQLQSQNWREALPYQIANGNAWAPGWEPGGPMEGIYKQAGLNYNPEYYRAVNSPAPGMPSAEQASNPTQGVPLPAWLQDAQQQANGGPYQSFPYDFELPNPFPQQSGNPMYDRLAGAYKSNPGRG